MQLPTPKFKSPPISISGAGVASVKVSDILNSEDGQRQLRALKHIKLEG